MIAALHLYLNAQLTDTSGLRAALRQVIAITVEAASRDANHGRAAHITVDVGSFLAAAGIDNSEAVRRDWSTIADSAGSKVTTAHAFCDEDQDLCPTIHATSIVRSGDLVVIGVTIASYRKIAHRDYQQSLVVTLQRTATGFRVVRVKGGPIP